MSEPRRPCRRTIRFSTIEGACNFFNSSKIDVADLNGDTVEVFSVTCSDVALDALTQAHGGRARS